MGEPTARAAVERLIASAPAEVRWGVQIDGGAADGVSLAADEVLVTASIGKIMLLAAVSHAIDAGDLDPDEPLVPTADDAVGDSGLWQHLRAESLSVTDAAVLVGAVSDNLATNTLLRRVGFEAVDAASARLEAPRTRMLDRIRDVRTDVDPVAPSQATARELCTVMARLAAEEGGDPRVRHWLAFNTDLSMVSSALCLDPLAHGTDGFISKTGTDVTVRADAGCLSGPDGTIAYAVIANWDEPSTVTAEAVVRAMRAIGDVVFAGRVP